MAKYHYIWIIRAEHSMEVVLHLAALDMGQKLRLQVYHLFASLCWGHSIPNYIYIFLRLENVPMED